MSIVKKVGLVLLGVIVLVLVVAAVAVITSARNPDRAVGAQQLTATDPGHGEIPVTLFYPTSDKPGWRWLGLGAVKVAARGAVAGDDLPLVILSHGTGGTPVSHLDTALALAQAGYVVAAPTHPGDNLQDQSSVGTASWMGDRARQLSRVVDAVSSTWAGRAHLAPGQVGVFGYSAGGTAALIAAGGRLDSTRTKAHCAVNSELICKILKPAAEASPSTPVSAESRIKAAVLVAPGLGFSFTPESLASVDVPVQIWAGAEDKNAPPASNARVIANSLPAQAGFHVVPNASHFSFLPPCGAMKPMLPSMLCTDPEGFDRADFQRSFNQRVVRFFDSTIGKP